MKKIAAVLLIGMMVFGLAACGGGEKPAKFESQQIGEGANAGTEAFADASQGTGEAQETDGTQASSEADAGQTTAEPAADGTGEQAAGGFEDNFAVDNETAAAFAQQIKAAVAAKDIEALADLAAFPVYVGFKDGGQSVETREDFVALGADKIFTPELAETMAGANKTEFPPSMAGFTVGDGLPGITFGVVNGELGIVGINY